MRFKYFAYGMSFVLHLGLWRGVSSIPKNYKHVPTTIKVFTPKAPKKAAKEAEADDKPPPPKKTPPPQPKNTPPPPPKAADSAPPPPTPQQTMAALPDFGISLSGGSGGIAVAAGPAQGAGSGPAAAGGGTAAAREKTVKALAPKPRPGVDETCTEDPIKPRALARVQPQYTDQARSAGLEGNVVVQLTVDASGQVVDAHIVKGLGHGLDEAAITAAKTMRFSPGTRCGKAAEATFTIRFRFALGE